MDFNGQFILGQNFLGMNHGNGGFQQSYGQSINLPKQTLHPGHRPIRRPKGPQQGTQQGSVPGAYPSRPPQSGPAPAPATAPGYGARGMATEYRPPVPEVDWDRVALEIEMDESMGRHQWTHFPNTAADIFPLQQPAHVLQAAQQNVGFNPNFTPWPVQAPGPVFPRNPPSQPISTGLEFFDWGSFNLDFDPPAVSFENRPLEPPGNNPKPQQPAPCQSVSEPVVIDLTHLDDSDNEEEVEVFQDPPVQGPGNSFPASEQISDTVAPLDLVARVERENAEIYEDFRLMSSPFILSGLLPRPALAAPFRALFPWTTTSRALSTTPASQAPKTGKKKTKEASSGAEHRGRIQVLRGNLHGYAPPPLRMARNRYLRHWTIHRAWLLHQRKTREARERELMRQHQGIHNACEELRLTEGPGLNGEGYLYRVAMEKIGLYNLGSVPIEYGRLQTETPARVAWNHNWRR